MKNLIKEKSYESVFPPDDQESLIIDGETKLYNKNEFSSLKNKIKKNINLSMEFTKNILDLGLDKKDEEKVLFYFQDLLLSKFNSFDNINDKTLTKSMPNECFESPKVSSLKEEWERLFNNKKNKNKLKSKNIKVRTYPNGTRQYYQDGKLIKTVFSNGFEKIYH